MSRDTDNIFAIMLDVARLTTGGSIEARRIDGAHKPKAYSSALFVADQPVAEPAKRPLASARRWLTVVFEFLFRERSLIGARASRWRRQSPR